MLDGVRDILGSEEEVAAAADVVVDGEEEIVESKASGDRKRQGATLSQLIPIGISGRGHTL